MIAEAVRQTVATNELGYTDRSRQVLREALSDMARKLYHEFDESVNVCALWETALFPVRRHPLNRGPRFVSWLDMFDAVDDLERRRAVPPDLVRTAHRLAALRPRIEADIASGRRSSTAGPGIVLDYEGGTP